MSTESHHTTVTEITEALRTRAARINVSPPPFDAILARAQGRPPSPPTAPPLSLPSVSAGPGASSAGASTAPTSSAPGNAPSVSTPATVAAGSAPGTNVANAAQVSSSSSASGPSTGVASSTGGPPATGGSGSSGFSRLLKIGVATSLALTAVVAVTFFSEDIRCVFASETSAAQASDASGDVGDCDSPPSDSLEPAAQALLDALRNPRSNLAAAFTTGDCAGFIKEAEGAIADASVEIGAVRQTGRSGSVNVSVEGRGPFPTAWVYRGGWKIRGCGLLEIVARQAADG